jgi:hypothetical protein
MGDDRVCPICQAINGYTWTFTDEPMPTVLIHPQFGAVWDITSGSEAHGHKDGSCRCHMEKIIELHDVLERAQKWHDTILTEYQK